MKFYLLSLLILLMTSCDERKVESEATIQKSKTQVPIAENFQPTDIIATRLVHGQSVYVPIYSSSYNGFEGQLLHLTAILSIRNISSTEEIIISQVDYFDTNGKLIKNFIPQPFKLGKMSSKDFVIPESDLSGGTGANFVVTWKTEKMVASPLIEAVMIGTLGTKGFSFTSRGKEIEAY